MQGRLCIKKYGMNMSENIKIYYLLLKSAKQNAWPHFLLDLVLVPSPAAVIKHPAKSRVRETGIYGSEFWVTVDHCRKFRNLKQPVILLSQLRAKDKKITRAH